MDTGFSDYSALLRKLILTDEPAIKKPRLRGKRGFLLARRLLPAEGDLTALRWRDRPDVSVHLALASHGRCATSP